MKLAPGGRVSGTVVWTDGTPAEGVRVLASQPGTVNPSEARTGADGSFFLSPSSRARCR